MHPVEQAATEFLEAAARGKAPLNQEFLNQCLESIKLSLLDGFHSEPRTEFKLRMSNIGKDTRQLMLEKKYGRAKATPDFLIKMLTGNILEHVLIYVLRSAGLEFDTQGETSIIVDESTIKGTWDLRLKVDNKIYDIKTASDWSFKNKFIDYNSLAEDDAFGYVDQLLGYASGMDCEPGGWIVLNKSSGKLKVITYPNKLEDVKASFLRRISDKIKEIMSGNMPPCRGVVPETFYQKLTGNRIIGPKCMFCDHKTKCHPTATLEPSRVSKAKFKPLQWYID